MLPARTHAGFERLFAGYIRRLFRKHFHAVWVRGPGAATDPGQPLLVYCNHSTWWDGFIALLVSREVLRRRQYVLMEERQLRRYPFFRYVGAFSVVREDPRDAARSLLYARSVLRRPGSAVWIFPQGEMHPSDHRPLRFHAGTALLARAVPGCRVLPAAVRCDFLGDQRPECFIDLGEPGVVPDTGAREGVTTLLEDRATALLDRLRADVLDGRRSEFRLLLAGADSVNTRLDRLGGRS